MGILLLIVLLCIIVPEIFLVPLMFFIVFCEMILRLFGKSLDDEDRNKMR